MHRDALLVEYWPPCLRRIEETLLALTGDDAHNPTMHLSSRTVLGSGQKRHEVDGPFPELEDELIAAHRDFWKPAPKV